MRCVMMCGGGCGRCVEEAVGDVWWRLLEMCGGGCGRRLWEMCRRT